MVSVQESLAIINRGCEELIVGQEMADKLAAGRPLRVKAGFDPTAVAQAPNDTSLQNTLAASWHA